MWGTVLIVAGAWVFLTGITSKGFYMTADFGMGPHRKAATWIGRLSFLLVGGLAIWKGISLLLLH